MTIEAAIIDLDGTIYRGEDPILGATEAVETIRDRGIDVLFVSNNPTRTPDEYVDHLAEMGIETSVEEVLPSGVVTAEYLEETHFDERHFVVGESGLERQLDQLILTTDPDEANVIVASIDRDFTYETFTQAIRAFSTGIRAFVGTDPDRTIPADDGGIIPGSGAIIGAVGAAVDREPDIVLGKPSIRTLEAALERLNVEAEACLMIGDRLDTDIAMGNHGMRTVLVESGIHARSDIGETDPAPDHILGSIADIETLLEAS